MNSDETHKRNTGTKDTVNQRKQTKATRQKNTKSNLSESEERFRLLCEAAEEGVAIHDNGVIVEANQELARMYGYELHEMIDMYGEKISTKESWKIIKEHIATGDDKPYEVTQVRKDGSTFECSMVGKPYKYKDRTLRVATFRDITERKQAEEKFRKIYMLSPECITITRLQDGFIMDVNKGFEDIIGEKREIAIGRKSTDHPLNFWVDLSEREFMVAELKAGRDVLKREFEFRRSDGSIRTGIYSARPINIAGETCLIFILQDITERKQSEELFKQSEAQYRLLADHMKDQVWLMDLDLKWKYISPSVEKLWGYTLEELIQLPLDKLLTEASFPTVTAFFSIEMPKALAASPNYSLKRLLEFECRCKNGRILWIESSFSVIRDENGKPLSLLGEGRDITERKQMEDSFRKSEENFRHSLDDSPMGVRISTIEGETIYANRAILEIYDYDSIEELNNISLKERYTPESYAEFQIRKAKRLKGELGPSEYEISIVRKDGEIRHVNVFRKEIFWNGKKQSQVIYQDITERKQSEEKLKETLDTLRRSISTTIQVLGTASEARDPYTAGHQRRVTDLARAIATEMGLSYNTIEGIRMAGAIHDIGKISVPPEILCKSSMLTNIEFSLIKNHSQFSYEIIKDVESPWPLADIVHQHHERMNGSGYPQGLKGENILIEARIIAVADVVEAMMSYRPYRPALGLEIALAEIENNTGTLYDRDVADACLKLFRNKGYQLT